jgi:hypothetical protein
MQRFILSCSGEYGSFRSSYSPHEGSFARFSTAEGVYEPQALSRANASAPATTSKERPWWLTAFQTAGRSQSSWEVLSYRRLYTRLVPHRAAYSQHGDCAS